ncbi:major facilitator superfamily domain-containing protein [Aspergillus undulatus]|uniref:major facilitator superfamily domain-containing protein n=1 Tax=Aspergillus undulatus TaxID=1810928 RepID=UPI003CCE4693
MSPTATDRKTSLDVQEPGAALESVEDVSEAERLLAHFPILQDKPPEELEKLNKAVLRKLDWYFLACVTMMLYLDRINVSNARLAGMQDDLGMDDTTWSAGISLFYVGYIISHVPANAFIAKGKPSILMPATMLAWSAVTICIPALTTGWGFCLCRFLVGFTEGPFVSAVSLLTSSWYTKKEPPLRMGIWYAGNIISNVFSGLLAAAILINMIGVANLRAWQWFILLEGIVSVIVAFLVVLAAKDPFAWMLATIHFLLIIAQTFKAFFPSIVDTLGLSDVVTYLVQASTNHCWHIVVPIMITLGGAVLIISTLNVGARYFNLTLLCTGPFVGLNIRISWETIVVPRPRTKRAALIAIANCVSWPRYQTGGGIFIAGCGLTVIFCLVAKRWCIRKK